MKATQSIKLDTNGAMDVKTVGMLVALLITIIICVMIYFEVTTSVDQFDEQYEEFGPYADTTNASAWTVTLSNSPVSSSDVNVTCVNISAGAESYPAFGLNHRIVRVAADAADNFTQVNVTYTSNIASAEASDVTPMAQTIFQLAPIIALVVIAGIILYVVIGFGGRKGGKI